MSLHGDFLAQTKEERIEQMEKYDANGLYNEMFDFLEHNPDYIVVDCIIGVAVKHTEP